jgi:hypothetical protein
MSLGRFGRGFLFFVWDALDGKTVVPVMSCHMSYPLGQKSA